VFTNYTAVSTFFCRLYSILSYRFVDLPHHFFIQIKKLVENQLSM